MGREPPNKGSNNFTEHWKESTMLSRIQAFRQEVLGTSTDPRRQLSRPEGSAQHRGFSAPVAPGRFAPAAGRNSPALNSWHEAIGAAMSIGGAAVAATVAAAAQHSGFGHRHYG